MLKDVSKCEYQQGLAVYWSEEMYLDEINIHTNKDKLYTEAKHFSYV